MICSRTAALLVVLIFPSAGCHLLLGTGKAPGSPEVGSGDRALHDGAPLAPDSRSVDEGPPPAPLPGCEAPGKWCWVSPRPVGNRLNAVSVADGTIFAVGQGGLVVRVPGGAQPIPEVLPGAPNLRGVWALSAASAIAVGEVGAVFRWNGAAWTREIVPGLTSNLTAVWAGPTMTVAVGTGGIIARQEGPTGWSVGAPVTQDLGAVWGPQGGPGVYAGGAGGTLLHLENSGAWTPTTIPGASTATIRAIWGTETGGVAVGGTGGLLALKPEGGAWSAIGTSNVEYLALSGTRLDDLWVVASTGVHLWDGAKLSPAFPVSATAVAMLGTLPVVVGQGSSILPHQSGSFHSIFPAGALASRALRGVAGASQWSVFAVGEGTVLLHFDGKGWQKEQLPPGTAGDFTAVCSSGSFLAVGTGDGTVLRRDTTGWLPSTKIAASVSALWCSAQGDLFASTGKSIFRLNLKTSTWELGLPDAGGNVRDFWGTGPGDVYAVGEGGFFRRWNGSAWGKLVLPGAAANEHWVAVHGSGADLFVANAYGSVFRRTGGVWSAGEPVGFNGGALAGDGEVLFAVDDDGPAFSRNEGAGFLKQPTGCWNRIHGLWGDRRALWAVGDAGTILHYHE